MILALVALGAAAEPAVDEESSLKWSGLGLPLVGGNSIDGFGFGAGGEAFARAADEDTGYAVKLAGALWVTSSLDYTSNWLRLDVRGERLDWLGHLGYRAWRDLRYAGVGGEEVQRDPGDIELGNAMRSPFGFLGVKYPIGQTTSLFVQVYGRQAWVMPGAGSLLEERAPSGVVGGTYADATVGVALEDVDQWPLPNRGVQGEVDVRAGGLMAPGTHRPLLGAHAEVIGWAPVAGPALVLGGRVVYDGSIGDRPFFEQDTLGGLRRDELGSEQALAGYGRTRTRGDGVLAAMVEVRPRLFATDHHFWDVGLYLSAFAEQGWLFVEGDPGPPMPTLGGGPEILWQKAIQLRPFLAWGWRSEGDHRQPDLQFGVSFVDPL